jgi:hypothetical protein
MQSAKISKAIVKKSAGNAVKSKFNDEMRIAVSVEKSDGTTETIWGSEKSELKNYRVGDSIEYTKNGNELIIFNAPQTPVSSQPNAASDSVRSVKAETKAEKGAKMLEDIEISTRLYAKIFQETQDRMLPFSLKDELLVSIATTQYSNIARKYI